MKGLKKIEHDDWNIYLIRICLFDINKDKNYLTEKKILFNNNNNIYIKFIIKWLDNNVHLLFL
jgi:hypothetical protein